MIKNRAWFLDDDNKFPRTLNVFDDSKRNKSWSMVTDFMAGKSVDLKKVGILYFYVEKSKIATTENILKWDFFA